MRSHTTTLHWACEDRDREGLLRCLRSGEFEGALPPLPDLEAVVRLREFGPVTFMCEQSLRLLRLASKPWGVLSRHLWPPSFRRGVAAVMSAGGELDEGARFTVLSFCGRGWWAGQGPAAAGGEGAVILTATVMEKLICDECQEMPMDRRRELPRSSRYHVIMYCRAVCQGKAWKRRKEESASRSGKWPWRGSSWCGWCERRRRPR